MRVSSNLARFAVLAARRAKTTTANGRCSAAVPQRRSRSPLPTLNPAVLHHHLPPTRTASVKSLAADTMFALPGLTTSPFLHLITLHPMGASGPPDGDLLHSILRVPTPLTCPHLHLSHRATLHRTISSHRALRHHLQLLPRDDAK